MTTPNAHGAQTPRADMHVRPDWTSYSYGTNPPHVYAHVGPDVHSNRSDAGNGFDAARVPAHVGPSPDRNEVTGQKPKSAHTHVGPELNGNTDTRGLVPAEERERLRPFGDEVRAMRKALSLSQEQLGKLAGIGTTHISRLEQARRRPSVDAIKALARILSPASETDAVERRLAALAGDSLRTGAARRKRQTDNKHRVAALREIERTNRKLKTLRASRSGGRDLSGLVQAEEAIAARLRAEIVAEAPGIRGVVPADEQARSNRFVFGRPRSRSLKDLEAWLDGHKHLIEADIDDDDGQVS
ncbi:helix-turn-helix transcriptional regulator [Arthrobacter sp. M4]|uniref:helix-turn-helix domain-containing protein n=1 Tax=Arthrobacter sp. M4 TaxID=218160 RepID=UPI0027E179C7|nr:helix-turn-helix transcriptional regulator [Arthrobacter sp. M4]MCA4132945.1 helix-turn-helix domain-containing protein [Arthrobacter sp. M4]